jgi:hypothetical protein
VLGNRHQPRSRCPNPTGPAPPQGDEAKQKAQAYKERMVAAVEDESRRLREAPAASAGEQRAACPGPPGASVEEALVLNRKSPQ